MLNILRKHHQICLIVDQTSEAFAKDQENADNMPTGHTTLLRRWINVNDVGSTSQQRVQWVGYAEQ